MTREGHPDRDILPDVVKPVHYDLSLYDMELSGAFSFQGTVKITAKILKNTKSIVLNSHQLLIHSSEVLIQQSTTQKIFKSSDISYNAQKQRAIIEFSEEIDSSESAVIVIKFQGTINNEMAGFYRSKYKPAVTPAASVPKDDEFHYMFSTQFESSDARRAFPCFDEPNLKATFDVEIEHPDDQVALSNMPVKSVRKGKSGLQVVKFDRTPIMSTYLLAWAVGDFELFSLRFSKINYPLPKLDMLSVHEFSHGAMENWGLITYRTSAILYDNATSSAKYQNRVCYVVAHELAHQWFGNLVTMDWWSELWLNEGFATWVGWLATDHLHPDWNVWPQFVTQSMQQAFKLDALRGSHPIDVPVRDALDVDQIFDAISYLKGSSVIRMLAVHLGLETFLGGVSNYLKAHSYGNATTNDLWSSLSHASGQDVNALMDPWIQKIGYPVLTVAEEPNRIRIKQSRYLSTGDVKPEDDGTLWWIPLGLKGKAGLKETTSTSLTIKEDTIQDVEDAFYKINADNTGFYMTNYPPARLASFGKHINRLTISDKIGLISDAGTLALSGDATTPGLLNILESFSKEENQLVWSQITTSLSTIKSIFYEEEGIAKALEVFTLRLIRDAVAKVGWEYSPKEDYLTGQLRALLIKIAGVNGDKDVIAEAQRRFQLFVGGDKSAIHPDLRLAVFEITVRYGGASGYEAVKDEWSTTSSIDGKEICLAALGKIQDSKTLLPDFFSFIFSKVAVQDIHGAALALAGNPKTRAGLWAHIKENWTMIREKLGGNMVVLDRFLKMSLEKFTDFETERDIRAFFKDKDNRGYDRTLGVVSDTIVSRARL